MSADIVNLRQVRKARARTDKERQAEQNRLTHGRTRAEKSLTEALNDKARQRLDQGRIETPKSED